MMQNDNDNADDDGRLMITTLANYFHAVTISARVCLLQKRADWVDLTCHQVVHHQAVQIRLPALEAHHPVRPRSRWLILGHSELI